MELLQKKRIVVGLKQSQKVVREGSAKKVYLALDAEPAIRRQIVELCTAGGVEVVDAASMQELGRACHIEVGAAVAAEI